MDRRWGFVAGTVALACTLSACMPGPDIRISTVAGTGAYGYSGDGGPAVAAQIRFPNDVEVDSAGNLYIADHLRVRRVDVATGVITTVAGDGTAAFDGDNQPATLAAVVPDAIAFDADDNLYIAEMVNHRIRRVDAASGTITTVAGTGIGGSWSEEDEGQAATSVQLWYPSGIDVDDDGNLFIADSGNNQVRRVDAVTGEITRVAGDVEVEEPEEGVPALDFPLDDLRYVTVGPDGSIYVTTQEQVHRIDGTTGIVEPVTGNGEWGFTGDGGPAIDAQVSHPNEVVVDDAGNLFLADGENGRVRMITKATGIITTVAGTDEWAYNGDDRSAVSATLQFPTGLALAPDGSLYIATDERIRKVTVGGAIGGVVRDASNQLLVGTTVELYAAGDLVTPLATDVTDTTGWYGFSVRPGDYRIRFVGDATHQGEWWSDAATGAAATTVTVTTGSLGGPTDAMTVNANLATP